MDEGLRLEHRQYFRYYIFFGPRLTMLVNDRNDESDSFFSHSAGSIFQIVNYYFRDFFVEEVLT